MNERKFEQEYVKEGAEKITGQDIRHVVEKSDEIKRRFRTGPLQRFVDDGRLMLAMVRDYWSGRFRKVPVGTIGAVAFALIYVLNPLDLMPDVLPIVGQIDDAAVVAGCLLLIEHDLRTYGLWAKHEIEMASKLPGLPPPPNASDEPK